jgi:apolipoprotein N-acyltransferase
VTPRRIALAVWDFVVGDDWRLALAAVVAIGLTAVVCALGPSAWWLAPLVALGALRWSLRGARPAEKSTQASVRPADQPDVQSPPK